MHLWEIIKRHWLILLIGIIALLVRLIGIGRHSFWFDEGLEVTRALTSWPEIILLNAGPDPPGYRLLIAPLASIATNETLLRLPSAIFSTLSVFIMYWWMCLLGQKNLGLVAASLLVISPIAVYYSQETSQYSLVIFFALLLLVAFEKATQTGGKWDWLFLGFAGFASLFTYYGLVFLFPILDIRLGLKILKTRVKENVVGFVAVHIVWLFGLVILYVYFIQVQYAFMQGGSERAEFLHVPLQRILLNFFDRTFHLVFRFQTTIFSETVPTLLPSLFILGVFVGMFFVWKFLKRGRYLIWSSISLIILLYVVSGFGFYLYGHRYALVLFPFLIVFLAASIWGIYRYSHIGAYFTAGIIALIFIWFLPNNSLIPNPWMGLPREELRSVLTYFHEKRQEDDFLYVYYGAAPAFQVYERKAAYDYVIGPWFRQWETEEKVEDILNAVQNYEQFWLVMSHISSQEDVELREALTNSPYNYLLVDEYSSENAYIVAFRKTP